MKNVVITHGYSSRNAGDGLLVDETVDLLTEALGATRTTVLAVDPGSFAHHADRRHPFTGGTQTPERLHFLSALRRRRLHEDVRARLDEADLVVAVGGGYLRAGSVSEYLKVLLAHVPQLPRAGRRAAHVYLPQSIGPLPPAVLPGFGALRRADLVCVRDDRSRTDLAARGIATTRVPDLAVLAIARRVAAASPAGPTGDGVGLVLRRLPRPRGYEGVARVLLDRLRPELLVQSVGRGNADPAFLAALGHHGPTPTLLERLPSRDLGVVVSVRLHGALQSILSGVPAVHLSYERKGWGAYEDLGIAEFVHNARDVDPELVVEQVERLRRDPAPFWERVRAAAPALAARRADLVGRLRTLATATGERDRAHAPH